MEFQELRGVINGEVDMNDSRPRVIAEAQRVAAILFFPEKQKKGLYLEFFQSRRRANDLVDKENSAANLSLAIEGKTTELFNCTNVSLRVQFAIRWVMLRMNPSRSLSTPPTPLGRTVISMRRVFLSRNKRRSPGKKDVGSEAKKNSGEEKGHALLEIWIPGLGDTIPASWILQSDIEELKKELEEQTTLQRNTEKEKAQLLQELTEQNHRLTAQLKQAARTEEQLQAQLQTLREQFNVRRSNLHDHVSQLEGLREEINVLEGRKADLGQRIHALTDERENLNLSLEESGDRIILLQKQNREQEQKIRSQQQDLEDLRQTNSQLQAKLDLILRRSPNGNSSLLDEIEMSAPSSMEDDASRVQENENMKHLAQEVIDIYHQLRRLCLELRRRRDNVSVDSGISSTTPEELQAQQVRVGMFSNLLQDFRSLIEDLLAQGPDMPCLACQSVAESTASLERLQKELQEKTDCLKEKNEEIAKISTKLTIQDTELAALREERDHLRHDVDSSAWAKDEIVKKAWTMRDQAVARKNAVEIELAKTRIELMHINSQLMEAVQQKVELSQQLDQWQLDMQALLDEQMKKKLKNYEQQEERRPSRHNQKLKRSVDSKGKLFKLFR
ncbi:Bicaudal D-related protein like protein [Argiope bruennichi]|uniref:Bicaudal D-related protein like protein n=1 Tax=Argiope bruennichi TaxID=94029 RepID=A0A8T0FP18_ARGBR|nr:Bicaudal D-related protein like protein [Argiope bruennichi]